MLQISQKMQNTFIELKINNSKMELDKKIIGRKLEKCRMCDSNDLYEFLDLGYHPPSDYLLKKDDLEKEEILFPLKVLQCKNCGLTQLSYVVDPNYLYGDKYIYESSITETGKRHFFDMADSIIRKFNFQPDSLAVDIGSNVGILLEGFKRKGLKVLGIDPAPKIAKIANERGIETWQELISSDAVERIVAEKGKAKIITGTNVFAHIDDKEDLMKALNILLDDNGVFIVEAPYLIDLIENLEYDTIYLEHLEYLSVKPLIKFFEKHNMDLFDVERQDIHGKSIRFFVCKRGRYPISENIDKLLKLEEEKGIYKKEILDIFAEKVKNHKRKFVNLLRDLKKENKKIVGISAPAKGNTFLNYCKIGNDLIDYMAEKSRIKPGKFTPGMHIPIVEEEKIYQDNPDYGIIFAWNFANEIMINNIDFAKKGGKFIIPVNNPVIKTYEDVEKLKKEYEEKSYVNGVIIKKINPVFSDNRGEISDLLNEKINHVGFITTEPEAVRGKHYHKQSKQYSYIQKGKFEVLMANIEKPEEIEKIILNAGEIMIIPPMTLHSFKAIEKSDMIDMISESREGSGYEDDVIRIENFGDQEGHIKKKF